MDMERRSLIVKKKNMRERSAKQAEEAMQDQMLKQEAQQKLLEEDLKRMRQYTDLMAEQEAKRDQEKRNRLEKQTLMVQRMSATGDMQKKEAAAAEEAKVLRQREEMAARALELDQNKAAKHKMLTSE